MKPKDDSPMKKEMIASLNENGENEEYISPRELPKEVKIKRKRIDCSINNRPMT